MCIDVILFVIVQYCIFFLTFLFKFLQFWPLGALSCQFLSPLKCPHPLIFEHFFSLILQAAPYNLTCLLRNLYASQETTVRNGHGTIDQFKIGEGIHQGCILSLCLFNLYAGYIMQNTQLYETQAEIKISGRNINSLRYADSNTLMAETKEELKNHLKVKQDSEKAGLKLNIQKTKIMASSPITSWQIGKQWKQ